MYVDTVEKCLKNHKDNMKRVINFKLNFASKPRN